MKKTFHQLIERVTGIEHPLDVAWKSALATHASLPEPDLLASHYQSRYVVLAIEQRGLCALDIRENSLMIAGGCAIGLAGGMLDIERQQALLMYLQKSPLVVFRGDQMQAVLEKHFLPPLNTPETAIANLDLAVLLPELFAAGPGPNADLSDWLAYFELPTDRENAVQQALACGRLFLCVLAKAAQQGASCPTDLIKLQKARRWLWSH